MLLLKHRIDQSTNSKRGYERIISYFDDRLNYQHVTEHNLVDMNAVPICKIHIRN